jgi:hypothetical protein
MTPDKRIELDHHIQAIAKILYEEADPTQIENLAGIEETIREQTLEYITPELGFFLSKKRLELKREDSEQSRVLSGNYQLQKNKQSD